MTTTKQLGLAGGALISLGAGAAYYATLTAVKGRPVHAAGMTYVILAAVAALTAIVLLTFWRAMSRSIHRIGGQLENMLKTGRIGLVMADAGADLDQITRPLNELLGATRKQANELSSLNRELQIRAHIAAAEKSHTEAIIFSISDAVLATNRFDELIMANEAAEKLLDFKLAGSLRKSIEQVISDANLTRLIRETRSHGRSFTRKVIEHTFDSKGSPRVFSITLSCVVTERDEVSGVVAVLHDMTREKEIARVKTDFVSNVSHELKTPLASIKAYIEMLNGGEVEDERTRKEFYEIITAEADRLHRLIENILNISRIESGVVKVMREPISLSSVAKEVLNVATAQAKAKNIELIEHLAPVYYLVEADRDMIYQSLMNLVSNAIKYTPAGGKVTVSVRVDENRKIAICDVADTGKGIGAEDLPKVFDKFYRVKGSDEMAKGTGLGLALVKHMIENVHDGRVSVTSEKGKGSTFSIELSILSDQ